MIVIYTDFGTSGPYGGQMRAVVQHRAPAIAQIDLMHDAPAHNPRAAAYLLAALVSEFAPGTVVLGVVDPGVGGDRPAVILEAGGRWFVGPGNGLFEIVARRGAAARWWHLDTPSVGSSGTTSATFHGRDLFAPAAARLALALDAGAADPIAGLAATPTDTRGAGSAWPDDLAEVIYIDAFGNAMTGLRADSAGAGRTLHIERAGGEAITRAQTFSDRPRGGVMWYQNAIGLIEIAVNRGRADQQLGLAIGTPVSLRS